MATTTRAPLSQLDVDVLSRYARGADITTIVEATGLMRDSVSAILVGRCSLNRNTARELLRFAPRAAATSEPARPLPPASRARKQRAAKPSAEERKATCPNVDQHTPHPRGHVQHSDWADEMMSTHEQQQCEGCGLWLIWVPKQAEPMAEPAAPTGPVAELEPAPDAPTPFAVEPAATEAAPEPETEAQRVQRATVETFLKFCPEIAEVIRAADALVDAAGDITLDRPVWRPLTALMVALGAVKHAKLPATLPPGTDLVVAYPVLVCRSCGFAGAVPQHHLGCSSKAVPGYCLIVAAEATDGR